VRVAVLAGIDGRGAVERLGEVAVLGLWIALVAPTVIADTFRAHHPPEQCLQGSGLAVQDARTWLVAPQMPVRVLRLRGRQGSALYWFQSRTRVTDDFAARVWARDDRWAMVSVLFDGSRPPPAELALLLQRFLARSVFGGPP
jgi:hypothetical protein